MSTLKDFQRSSVDYVFSRMYTDSDRTHRFLLADEVGLGKTMVAKGVVAKTIDHLWDHIDRIDIVYICSSGDIARQNVDRLNITGEPDWALVSRATLLPSQIRDIQRRKVNFIAFTPGTTFQLSSSAGRADERVLLYCLLEEAWGFRGTGPQNVFQAYVEDYDRFRGQLNRYDRKKIEPLLHRSFIEALQHKERQDLAQGLPTQRDRFHLLCNDFGRMRSHIPRDQRKAQTLFLGELRSILAATCIRALEPDLVILDEFQRFKDLLSTGGDDETEEAALARELFDYTHESEKTRLLMLSATPYKMYTTVDELETDDHYSDFLQTVRFLHNDRVKTEELSALLTQYRHSICRTTRAGEDPAIVRDQLQTALRKIMARTERLGSSEDRNGMLREIPNRRIDLGIPETLAYHRLQCLADQLKQPDTIEYWKAAPYLLSFMDEYRLKRGFEELLKGDERPSDIAGLGELFLPDRILRGRAPVEVPHARLQWLTETCIDTGAWRLLWIPSASPYYQSSGVFADPALKEFTKRLLFSAWHVVPKAVAALLSHEAERRMLEGFGKPRESLTKVREQLFAPLQFTRSDGRLAGMPVLGLMYPSIFLAGAGDPYQLVDTMGHTPPSRDELLHQIESLIQPAIVEETNRLAGKKGPIDETWYWAAPILLDLRADPRGTREWLMRIDASERWSGLGLARENATQDTQENSGWQAHVLRAQEVIGGTLKLGPPPADLTKVLAELALGAPAVVALRALGRVTGGNKVWKNPDVRDYAGQIAWSFRNLFNLPEVIALVRSLYPEEPYWRRTVEYSIDGNLQAVMDEYAHVLKESLGLFDHLVPEIARKIAIEIRKASGLRSAPVIVDELVTTANGKKLRKQRLRARFAARFGEEVDVDDKKANRKDLVRSAFNSPFWPFVLATTSVGQEGLDFHHYCHAVVHWNLPSNPVDLEQREGRVHRYKGHAVRKNIAERFRSRRNAAHDPWSAMFDAARNERDPSATDIVPYWVYPIDGGAVIERHVPRLPLTREDIRLHALRRSLTLYRMVFGQPRQDELLSYLMGAFDDEHRLAWAANVRIDLSPQPRT